MVGRYADSKEILLQNGHSESRLGDMLDPVVVLFQFIPKSLLSLLIGALARWRLPRPLARRLVKSFVRAFRLDLSDAERPLADYATVEDVFTRALKPGARVVEAPLCSPADGYLAISAPAED